MTQNSNVSPFFRQTHVWRCNFSFHFFLAFRHQIFAIFCSHLPRCTRTFNHKYINKSAPKLSILYTSTKLVHRKQRTAVEGGVRVYRQSLYLSNDSQLKVHVNYPFHRLQCQKLTTLKKKKTFLIPSPKSYYKILS